MCHRNLPLEETSKFCRHSVTKMRHLSLFCLISWGSVWSVTGKECYELQTREEHFQQIVQSTRSRTKAVKKGRRYKTELEDYVVYEEKLIRRNVTFNITKCCQGFQREKKGCVAKQDTVILKSNVPDGMKVSSVAVPTIMLILMFVVSVAVVYRLYSKDKPCKGISQTKNGNEKPVIEENNEFYTEIRGLEADCRQYDELRNPQRHAGGSPMYEEVEIQQKSTDNDTDIQV
ncbi:uncharacterized protein LOC125646719 [Ostrea edulis]|uniref:uncharacterized protein LOC125646719 n=1 Tax=Ostrea edulis TaxID=37623 RepID=UPI0024AEDA46|nr:uncharacterized protein LOC125646719 [Ostrea edulis]